MHLYRLALVLTALSFVLSPACSAPAADADGDGIPDAVETKLGLLPQVKQELVPIATSKNENYSEEQAAQHAPDILALDACHVGGNRLLFRVTFARKPNFIGATLILYADMDNNPQTGRKDPHHGGVDLMAVVSGRDVSLSLHNNAYDSGNSMAGGTVDGNVLYLVLDAPLAVVGDQIAVGVHLLVQRAGGRSDGTPHRVAMLPRSAQAVPKLDRRQLADLRGFADYRYHNDVVKLERLEDKGLTYGQVAPKTPITIGRPRPAVPFSATARQPGKSGSATRERVRVHLLEEAGVARKATPIRFGFPLAKGALFDAAQVRILSPGGTEIPCQVTPTSFWPDDSLKWVLVQFAAPLKARESTEYTVEFGSQVKRAAASSPLKATETDAQLTVTTGPLQAVIDKRQFNLLQDVRLDANGDGRFAETERVAAFGPDGIRLVDERGKLFTASARPPESVRFEEQGPCMLVVRVEGAYAAADGTTYMRYIARLTFRAGSPRVELALTHLNDYLRTEFTDITSLSLPFAPSGSIRQGTLFLRDKAGKLQPREGRTLSLFQEDEAQCLVRADGQQSKGGQAPGVIRVSTERGALTVAVRDFWQRWPKGLSCEGNGLSIDLLPAQPGPEYGKNLPHYLLYPFVEGKYRFKWGVSFTERISFDFSGQTTPEEIDAETNAPVIAVLPASWYASTGALGRLAAPLQKQFSAWDAWVAAAYQANERSRVRTREYGYLNYGDWFGERGRNWGNNEYDFAHGFFMQFARTGNRDYFRAALIAARHQADVDCVHAYPDPYYVGANHQHSIGHTGTWSQNPPLATWSHRYDYHTEAANGHTWADGMVDAWYLTGDARVMEAAIGLGEHIVWAAAPAFKALGTHERSAGWSIKAVLAIYRATGDPKYLEAARHIGSVALSEQKFDEGGAWPHTLPRDHAGDRPGARGNNLFLIGILLGGLQALHEETGDPAVRKSLIAAAEWVLKSWDEVAEGWPYSALVTGEPLYKPSTSLNLLIVGPIAYVGHLTGDERFIRVAESGLRGVVRQGADAFGKSVAQKMHFTSGTLALLQEWYARRPDKGARVLDGSDTGLEEWAARTPVATLHNVRAPDEKRFFVRLDGPTGELVAKRSPHGSMMKRAETGTLRVLDAAGKVVHEEQFSTDTACEIRCPLRGAAGALFRVVIQDDQRSVWDLSGDGLGIVTQTVPGFRFGGVGRARYHFFVPAGTKEFRIHLLGVHSGTYGGAAITPDGKIAAVHQDSNPGQAFIEGAPKGTVDPRHPERGTIVVKPAPADTGKVWSLVVWAAMDLGCELEGVPPYLSRTAQEWFDPGR
ncbi:MAG TPA: hypothetical protein PLU39_12830 [Armatimonadota bacterium]|nr:hypothetical protein [Armatimonadota bacterium]HPT98745.1 hypothetical protein [Armatimonadota bacterium]